MDAGERRYNIIAETLKVICHSQGFHYDRECWIRECPRVLLKPSAKKTTNQRGHISQSATNNKKIVQRQLNEKLWRKIQKKKKMQKPETTKRDEKFMTGARAMMERENGRKAAAKHIHTAASLA
jgi:hypothetical protein